MSNPQTPLLDTVRTPADLRGHAVISYSHLPNAAAWQFRQGGRMVSLEIATGKSIMAIGGWSSDPAPTLSQFITYVKDGKIGAPVKGAMLIGNGPDSLTKVAMVGNDSALDAGIGTCGKNGQGVPVGIGQPSLKMGGLTVGGTAA